MIMRIICLVLVCVLGISCSTHHVQTTDKMISVYVRGEVPNPGKYELREERGSVSAIVLAGGFTGYARKGFVVVFEENGRSKFFNRDIHKILKGEQPDIALRENCVVVVLPDCWGVRSLAAKPSDLLK